MESKLHSAFFESIRVGDLNSVQRFIKRGVSVDAEDKGKPAIYYAAKYGKKDIVRFLLEVGAKLGPNPSDVLDLIEQNGPGIIRAIDCFDGNTRENFAQEGINYDIANLKLEQDREKNLAKVNTLANETQKIPLITHHIYFSLNYAIRPLDKIPLKKTLITINELDKTGVWQHYFWTNNVQAVPEELKGKVKIRLIEELEESSIYKELVQMIRNAKDKADLVSASDIARIIILETEGGFYFDNDYEIRRAKKLYLYSKAFDFIAGKEADETSNLNEARLIGNSILAASPHHPIFYTSVELVKRNFAAKETTPIYVNMPCSKASEVAYKAGGPVITTAYFLSANQNTTDIVLKAGWLYNFQYAWSVTPDSPCHRPGAVVHLDPEAIGFDMFCGGWISTNMIYYPQKLQMYLCESILLGYKRIVEYFYNMGASFNKLCPVYNESPLQMAKKSANSEIIEFIRQELFKQDELSQEPLETCGKDNSGQCIDL